MYIQPLSRRDRIDINMISPLIPARHTAPDARTWPNIMIRLYLSKVSNLSVAYLALIKVHHLSFVELRRRMKLEWFIYHELFALSEMLCAQTRYGKAGNALALETYRQIIDRSHTADRQDVLDMLLLYCHSQLQRDWSIMENVLACRTDSVELLVEINSCRDSSG